MGKNGGNKATKWRNNIKYKQGQKVIFRTKKYEAASWIKIGIAPSHSKLWLLKSKFAKYYTTRPYVYGDVV